MSSPATATDLPIQATLKVRESLWKRMKIEAINRGVNVSVLAEESFERLLGEKSAKPRSGSHGKVER